MVEQQRNRPGSDALLAALKILAREKGNASRLRAQLPGEVGEASAEEAIGELEARGVFAVKGSASRVSPSLQGKSDAIIREKLAAHLLTDKEVAAAMAELPPEVERATATALKKWPTLHGRDDYERAAKLIRFLMGRGFQLHVCREVARSVASLQVDEQD